MTHTTQVFSDEQIEEIRADVSRRLQAMVDRGQLPGDDYCDHELSRAIESATLKAVSGQVDCGHLFDLRYTLDVLHKVRSMISDQDGAHAELGAAIVGMRYIISRTERTTHALPPAQPAPVDEREAFERYMTDNGKWPHAVQRYDDEPKGYILLQTANAWEVWQARAALQCAQAPQPTKGQP